MRSFFLPLDDAHNSAPQQPDGFDDDCDYASDGDQSIQEHSGVEQVSRLEAEAKALLSQDHGWGSNDVIEAVADDASRDSESVSEPEFEDFDIDDL